MDQKWIKYTYVCHTCDSLIEYTSTRNVMDITCECGGTTGQVSVEDATILPITKKKEDPMETMTDSFMQTKIIELEDIISRQNSALTTHQNCDYWKSENGRIQGQIIELINDAYTEDIDATNIVESLCEIIDYNPKKEIEFTATIRFNGRIDVPLIDLNDFNLMDALSDAYVDINNGDIVIDDYDIEEAEEQ
jgi:hypothetical protein